MIIMFILQIQKIRKYLSNKIINKNIKYHQVKRIKNISRINTMNKQIIFRQ